MYFLNQCCLRRPGTLFTMLICLLLFTKSGAQSGSDLRLNVEDLYSTHSNHFAGASASYNRYWGNKWALGVGVEYSGTAYHDDNGWNLYHLNFIPVYVSAYFNIGTYRQWTPYAHLQEGISFAWYDKEFPDHPGTRHRIREKGGYGYGGAGTRYAVSPGSGFFLEAGMKAFHLSFNNLDVNPHGFTSKLGYVYRLQ
ncbi:hypothetical protein [Niabella drilacis]|uniref:Outer membrane protein beta-barrel domain-containing protein n=1 Tax=Niabella drilacis (strain DSM 25811 / CCM 8410 / CCUG 62505 / LMG 26954 / E90) TaxID=1285928 RepID=A0A1G7AH79_NIADE|nr:hypothetical protein [Niabella drilacis]SDE14063.1 hypothetical protein SAMN04487894_12312 [Niabella drilacis]